MAHNSGFIENIAEAYADDHVEPDAGLCFAIDSTWCDLQGVYAAGWLRAGGTPVASVFLRSGPSRAETSDFREKADGSIGFACYLPCEPFRPVTLGFVTTSTTVEHDLAAVVQHEYDLAPGERDDPYERFIEMMKRGGGVVAEIGARAVSPGAVAQGSKFEPECRYVGVDIHSAAGVDIVADAHFLSDRIEPHSLDGLFSLAVLEHIAAPWLFAAEVNRVLKPGGLTFHLLPQAWPVHEMPNDFWRMTDEALKILFGPSTGFEIVEAAMSVPSQMIMPPEFRHGSYLELPLGRMMAASYIIARKVATIEPGSVSWPLSRDASSNRSRQYPVVRVMEPTRDPDAAVLQSSAYFDSAWYLATYPDVASAGLDAVDHYLQYGAREGRDPGPNFQTAAYLHANADVAANGINPLVHYVRYGLAEGRRSSLAYDRWLENDALDELDRIGIADHIATLTERPTFSVIMTTYETEPAHLEESIRSIEAQLYPFWDLCIADDASSDPSIRHVLDAAMLRDSRIRVTYRDRNGGISDAGNAALGMATGAYVAFVDHDDLLHETALYEVAVVVADRPSVSIVYSDSDEIDGSGRRSNPNFKMDWNPELMLGQNLVSHFGVYKASAVAAVGGLRPAFDGSQDYDLALRISEIAVAQDIRHVATVLYHWRRDANAGSFSTTSFERCLSAARRAVGEHLDRRGIAARIEIPRLGPVYTRPLFALPAERPAVSIVVLDRDGPESLRRCLQGLLERTDYARLDVTVVAQSERLGDLDLALQRLLEDCRVRRSDAQACTELGAFDAAVRQATGEVVCLLDARVRVECGRWLEELVSQAVRVDVGAVGPKIVDERGFVIDMGRVRGAADIGRLVHRDDAGPTALFALSREVSALSGFCLVLRRSVFLDATNPQATEFEPIADVHHLSIRLSQSGRRVIWTPHAEVAIEAAQTVAPAPSPSVEPAPADPFYNENLSLESLWNDVALPTRRVRPWAAQRRRAWVRAGQIERAQTLLAGVDRAAAIVEIGPSYSPIAPKALGWRTTIVDHATRAALVEKYRDEPDVYVERIEDVDHVWSAGSLADAVPVARHGTFDVFIASHVIEHAPNFVAFLHAAQRLLAPDGIAILAVPDKRYTFDYFRPVATTADILEAHDASRERHSRRAMFSHYAYFCESEGNGAWGQAPLAQLALKRSFDAAMEKLASIDVDAESPYVDVHAWQFTPSSFSLILLELGRLKLSDLQIESITPATGCEFHVRLRLGDPGAVALMQADAFEATRFRLLAKSVQEMGEQVSRADFARRESGVE